MDFHQIFRGCLPQDHLELIRFWGYPVTTVATATLVRFLGFKVVGVPQPKPCMDFHQIFRGCLPQDHLELIRFWGYPVTTVAMATLLRFLGFKVVGVPQPKPCMDFHQIFRGCLPQDHLELIRFWGYPVTTVAMATLLRFLGFKVVGVPQPKPCMDFHQIFRGCLPQDHLELIRFWGYPVTTVAMATLLRFLGFKVVGVPQPKPCMDFHQIFRICLLY